MFFSSFVVYQSLITLAFLYHTSCNNIQLKSRTVTLDLASIPVQVDLSDFVSVAPQLPVSQEEKNRHQQSTRNKKRPGTTTSMAMKASQPLTEESTSMKHSDVSEQKKRLVKKQREDLAKLLNKLTLPVDSQPPVSPPAPKLKPAPVLTSKPLPYVSKTNRRSSHWQTPFYLSCFD